MVFTQTRKIYKMERKLQKREDVRKSVMAVLLPHKDGLDINQLDNEYEIVVGEHIPWKDLGHYSLKNFLLSITESIQMERINNKLIVKGIPSEKSKHIKDLVDSQKDPKSYTRRKGFRSSHYFPNTAPPRNQLPAQELTHAIYQQKDMIYPKKNVIIKSNVKDFNNILTCNVHAAGNVYESEDYIDDVSESTNRSMDKTNDSKCDANQQVLINDRLKNRLEKLIDKYPDGMWCAELPNKFLEEYKVHLRYTELGFDSIIKFVEQLFDIFRLIKFSDAIDFKIYDAKKPLPKMEHKTKKINIARCEALSKTVTPNRSMIPDEVMAIGDQIDFINVEDLKQRGEDFYNVIVVEVFKPTFFWVQLYEKRKIFERFNENLHDYYTKNSDQYKIPADVLEKGLYCTCVYDEIWCRGIIIDIIEPDNVKVGFLDYGTLKTYSRDSVYYLDKMFSTLPAQAIACSLHNVKPYRGPIWTSIATCQFTERIIQKPLVAIIIQTDKEDNMMKITLADTSEDYDLHINDWLVQENIASYGKIVPHKRQNFLFQCFLENQKRFEQHRSNTIKTNTLRTLISHNSSSVEDKKANASAEPNDSNSSSNEEIKNNLTTKFRARSSTTLANLFRHLQNSTKTKLKHEDEIKSKIMSTKDLKQDETICNVPQQYAMHFDIKDPDDDDALDWKNYNQQRDTSFSSTDWSHTTESEKCVSDISDDKVPKIGKNVPLAESNFLKAVYASSYGSLRDEDIPWSPSGNVNKVHNGTLEHKSCNTSKSDDSSCEINRIATDNSNYNDSKLVYSTTEKVNKTERVDLSSKSDNTSSESNKNDFFNMKILKATQKLQFLKHNVSRCSAIDSDDLSTLNESIAFSIKENISKESDIEIGSNKCFGDSIKTDTANVRPKRRFKFPASSLNLDRKKTSSSSEILAPTNDSESLTTFETENSNFMKDIDVSSAYLPHSVNASTTNNSEESDAQSQEVVEVLTEGELIQRSEIPVFNDVDLESYDDDEWDIYVPNPLDYLRNNLCFNTVTENSLTEGVTITEISDSNEVEISTVIKN